MLADSLAALLVASPGLTAGELAAQLSDVPDASSLPERAVSFVLYASSDRFYCDSGEPPGWRLVGDGRARHAGAGTSGSVCTGKAAASARLARVPVRPSEPSALPAPFTAPLYAWQQEALEAWSRAARRGVVEAVTGTGKTRVGIAATLGELARRGQVLVLVPTVELQGQWVAELRIRLPGSVAIGRLGAGAGDTLLSHDVVVAVVNSARALDVRPIRRGGLLVADECHRYASSVNHLALDERFTGRLGLSATYERDDGAHLELLDPYFGGTCYSLGYERAVADEVTAHFSVVLVGVRLEEDEQCRYDELTHEMAILRARLIAGFGLPPEPFDAFLRALIQLAETSDAGASLARRYRTAMLERRRLLADTPAKTEVLTWLTPAMRTADRTIVFTQSIAASERSCMILLAEGMRAGVIHSAMSGGARRDVLRRFAAGEIDVISAPRVLDEGIDVPAADLAVLVGASRSRRQMIQRMGRVLRRKPDGRAARFAVLYVEGTVEDPALGAHEAFLDEITAVADTVRRVPADLARRHPSRLCDALALPGRTAPQPAARLALAPSLRSV
ncbi:MAG: DEAD/DEAH box helicase [Acidimicrobiales bacterium]